MDDIFVLIVEDEPLIGENLSDSLQEAGYSTHLVRSGAEAIAMLEAGEAAISGVVTDVRLGSGPNGWDVAHRARELIAHIPIVYVTGDSAHEHTIYGVPDSVVIQKPFAVAQIITAISTLLNASSREG